MDGGKVSGRRTRAHARKLATGAAMVAGALLSGAPAVAQDVPPASRFAVGSEPMLVAQQLARATWGVDPCGGQVEVAWGTDEPLINARSYWANPRTAYDDPQLNTQCRIVFNSELDFSWEKFCTVLVHEYGHLAGRPHSADGPDVMSPIYRAPIADCAATPEPGAPSPPAPSATIPGLAPVVIDAPARAKPGRRAKPRIGAAAKRRAATRQGRMRARARARVDAGLKHFSTADRSDGHHGDHDH